MWCNKSKKGYGILEFLETIYVLRRKNGVIISLLDSCGTKYIYFRGRKNGGMKVVTKIFLCNLYEFLLFQRNEISYKISFLLHKYGVLRKFARWEGSYPHILVYALHFKVVWFTVGGNYYIPFLRFVT